MPARERCGNIPVCLPENVVVASHSSLRLLVQFAFFHKTHHGKQVLLKGRPAKTQLYVVAQKQ